MSNVLYSTTRDFSQWILYMPLDEIFTFLNHDCMRGRFSIPVFPRFFFVPVFLTIGARVQ